MDAVTLDGLLAEMAPRFVGRHLSRPRVAGASAIEFEVSAEREHRLRLDASRATAGIYWLTRQRSRTLADLEAGSEAGRARHALLSFRKHTDGLRVQGVRRVAGERIVVLDVGNCTLVLRLGGSAPSLTLAVEGRMVASVGDGLAEWPPPEDRPEREWIRLVPEDLAAAVERARATDASTVRAVLDCVPGLGPRLAREVDEHATSAARLVECLRSPQPTLRGPGAPESWQDADLAAPSALSLLPCALPGVSGLVQCPSWIEAAALFLEGRLRGTAFESRRRSHLEGERKQIRRLAQLVGHLEKDVRGLDDEEHLRRQGEAVLAALGSVPRGAGSIVLVDPRDCERRLEVTLDPRLTPAGNADRLFERARRVERARRAIAERMSEAQGRLRRATEREEQLLAVRNLGELPAAAPDESSRPKGPAGRPASGPLHFLTTRGLSVLVGRGGRENHQLTFGVARPEDHWFHAQDVPGAHVILRDREGRATPDDLREAAEVAAFHSDARSGKSVDVHAARRKHIKPARGGPGRVVIGHAETLRVSPRDPEGRLRRR